MICPHCQKAIPTFKATPEMIEKVVKLKRQGYSARDIAQLLGNTISFATVSRIIRKRFA